MKTEKKTIKKIIAGGVAFVCACTAGIVGFATNWFGAGNVEGFEQNNQLSFGSFFGSGLSLAVASAETVDATSEGKTTLSVTVTPAELAPYVKVDWSVAWQNADSEWATGKTVTDYVTVTPTADGALTAEVACKAAFGEKVVVSVSVRDDATLKAECVCDYRERFEELTIELNRGEETFLLKNDILNSIELMSEKLNTSIELAFLSGTGTGTLDINSYYAIVSYEINPTFQQKLKENGIEISTTSYKKSNSMLDIAIPAMDLLPTSTASAILSGVKRAKGQTITITEEVVNAYMSYRTALEEMAAMSGNENHLITVTFQIVDAEDYKNAILTELSSHSVRIYAQSGYLPAGLADSVSVTQTNVVF